MSLAYRNSNPYRAKGFTFRSGAVSAAQNLQIVPRVGIPIGNSAGYRNSNPYRNGLPYGGGAVVHQRFKLVKDTLSTGRVIILMVPA